MRGSKNFAAANRNKIFSMKAYENMSDEDLMNARVKFVNYNDEALAPVQKNEIIGLDYVLETVEPYIIFLKNFQEFSKQCVEIDCGMFLYGPPGIGKTYIARYVATQSQAHIINVQNFPRTDSKFRVDDIHTLFHLCKEFIRTKQKPIILFWDEFDASAGKNKAEEEMIATLKSELEGISGRVSGIFIIATSNDAESSFDPALLRTGRIGKKIKFLYHNKNSRAKLLNYFVQKYPHAENLDFETLGYMVHNSLSTSDIEGLVNEAWRDSCIRNLQKDSSAKPIITQDDLTLTILRKIWGDSSNVQLPREALRRMAIYELGKAIVARSLNYPLLMISIPNSGYNMTFRVEDSAYGGGLPIEMVRKRIVYLYGGIAAQEKLSIATNLIAENDFDETTKLAQLVIERYREDLQKTSLRGLAASREASKLPSLAGVNPGLNIEITSSIDKLTGKALSFAKKIINKYNPEDIEALADILIEKQYLLQPEIDAFIKEHGGEITSVEFIQELVTEDAQQIGLYL